MTKDESDLIIAEQNKSTEEILKAVAKVKADYHELCKLKDMRIAELEKENAELKEKVNILDNCDRLGDVITEAYKEQLTKATEIIKKLYAVYYDPCVTESDLKYRDELFAEIKQFLSEVEK